MEREKKQEKEMKRREEARLKKKRRGLKTHKVRAFFLVTVTVAFSALLLYPVYVLSVALFPGLPCFSFFGLC